MFAKKLIPEFWAQEWGGLRAILENGVPTGRSRLGGHGQGVQPIVVPNHIVAFVLHQTAAAIVFLVSAGKNAVLVFNRSCTILPLVSTLTNNRKNSPRANFLSAVLLGGSTIALFDAANPVLFWWTARGLSPAVIFKSIASGLLGKDAANNGGAGVVYLGIFLHVFIACTVAAVYCVASWRLPVLIRRWVVCGITYGAVVYGVMNYIVLPLSRAKPQAFQLFELIGDLFGKGPAAVMVGELWFLFNFLGHLLGIGPLAAWSARWSGRRGR